MVDSKVKSFDVNVRIDIYSYTHDDGTIVYEWWSSNGDSSDELYDSIEGAEESARNKY